MEQGKHGRFYCRKVGDEIVKAPSVTTVLASKGTHKKSSGTSPSMAMGTLTHYHITRRYTKKMIEKPTDHIWNTPRSEVFGRVRRALTMWEALELPIQPVCVETALFNRDPLYAGRMDILARLYGDLTLIDIKTGMQYDDHVIQAAAYWNMLRRRPQVCFIYLDSIIDRNPDQKAVVRYFTQHELEYGYEQFLDCYVDFEWPEV